MKRTVIFLLVTGYLNVAWGAVPLDCADLDMTVKTEGNAYIWDNPNAKCDLALSLPGLPEFSPSGYLTKSFDACKSLKKITDGVMDQINSQLEQQLTKAVSNISDETAGILGDITGTPIKPIRDGQFGTTPIATIPVPGTRITLDETLLKQSDSDKGLINQLTPDPYNNSTDQTDDNSAASSSTWQIFKRP